MGSTMPLLRFGKGLLLAVLLVAVAACARTPTTGVGNISGDAAGGGGAPGSQQEFLVSVGDRVFFETDSSVLTADAQATLNQQSQWLQQYSQYRIVIEGHADERGTREYNIALGARRATAVVNYLVSRGIPQERLSTVSYGKERPVAICNDISCWSQNRRAVTVLTN
ncbi:peptidoglycan-associated lipoprotein Pal [Pelagibacterium halotolerans]|uniref:Peptidoglycan-associated protein n=1 Tax=Pelagibacterium halotolerans (strain DSM 22347 / JCM 15775 / CGMCC 1.7692 / B2) TaxID=1082931 RepID=G4R977_PELHB|nr:peptidoglycan-associated lipoprotein Pal [Pelagibacterium halotolerans]AEQ52457.1 outer membrane lipoprotein Omp16 [Pelagibacterium halotolerans B2]SEA37002.1 peptidoglycan-associated lipoprotein [Pelagibacterium halotolerans]